MLTTYIEKQVKITVLSGSATWVSKVGAIKNSSTNERLIFKEDKTGQEWEFKIFEIMDEGRQFKTINGTYAIELI